MFFLMEGIVRIFVVGRGGKRETFAFDIGSFVSYNVDTRCLTLRNGSVFVHADSEDDLIKAYREWGGSVDKPA